jgi:hypothetical protein
VEAKTMQAMTPSEADRRALVRRVLASPGFAHSDALRSFLLFVTEHAINGTPDQIKEHRIGAEVLGRKPDYDPAADNIVRVRAHELRERLARYFNTTGSDELLEITIPKGSYVPDFHPREGGAPASQGIEQERAAREPARETPRPPWSEAQWTAMRDLWAQIFPRRNQQLMVVAADASFALWQDITGQSLSLGEYLSRKYVGVGDPLLREVAVRRCVAPADLVISLNLVGVSEVFGARVQPHYARNVSMADLRVGNAVILGSRRSNPWVQLFEPRLNFVLAPDSPSGGPRFENRQPKPAEPASFGIPCRFDMDGTERTEMESYALVALVPNLSDTGHVLVLEGLNMEATEAAGEAVTNAERLVALLREIGHPPGKPVPHFEALIRLTSMPGGYTSPTVIAYRDPSA